MDFSGGLIHCLSHVLSWMTLHTLANPVLMTVVLGIRVTKTTPALAERGDSNFTHKTQTTTT